MLGLLRIVVVLIALISCFLSVLILLALFLQGNHQHVKTLHSAVRRRLRLVNDLKSFVDVLRARLSIMSLGHGHFLIPFVLSFRKAGICIAVCSACIWHSRHDED